MSEIRLNIDGLEVMGFDGQTILDIARENGIKIPTLCHDDRVKVYGSCGICVVEAEGMPRLLRSCSTLAANGMIVKTNTKRVLKSRKTALELLLSDHVGDCRPPCALACPGQTDCQGYVGLIANGENKESVKLIKDKIPLPGSIGRVCPHPCETACRRKMVEEPISIAALKSYAADKDMLSGELYTAEIGAPTGKNVAVIGGGPGGLSAAYFLRTFGHEVTIFDAMPYMGGMLRYGIPEYRLPKAYLQHEIDAVENMGVTFKNNIKIGRDLTLDYIKATFDATIVAVGAWSSTSLRCKGEDLDGVLGGIDFLRDVATNKTTFTGRKIAIVGGGNTAMDACRTSIRLGADKVYNVYRRTKSEMPAEEIEIIEAEEEGVIFKNLTNPIEVVGENGKVKALRLQIMELGEPDVSGRRAPVEVAGKEETIDVDIVIVAIGQKLDAIGLDGIELTKWQTISADEHTFLTSQEGIFAIGDATNKGADIAISAIGEAKKAADMVDKHLNGEELSYQKPFLVETNPTASDFTDKEKQPRAKMPHRKAEERRHDFLEVNLGLSDEEAVREANRCLECGCHDYFECKLIDLANQYSVEPQKFAGTVHVRKVPTDHPFIQRNPDKCILCGLCVRICDEVVGATALGLVDRGFNTIVKPALDLKLQDTDCISCGQCVSACPTGALTETMMIKKQVPTHELETLTTCAFCSVGCQQKLTHTGDMLIRALPTATREADALLCMKGRFGFGEIAKLDRLIKPQIKLDGKLQETTYEKAIVYANKRLQSLQTQYGQNSVAVTISDRYTNEQALLIKEYANKVLRTENVFSIGKQCSGMADTLGFDCSTVDFEELKNTGCILLVESDIHEPHLIAGLAVKKAVANGAKLVAVNSFDSAADDIATMRITPDGTLTLLKQLVKVAFEKADAKTKERFSAFTETFVDIAVSDEAKAAAELYLSSKKSVIVYEHAVLSNDAARLLAALAVISGHIGKPREGIIQLRPNANSQGLANLSVKKRGELKRGIKSGEIKGLFIFGEDAPGFDLSSLEFLAVHDLQFTETAQKADAVFPAQSFAEQSGTFTNTVGKVQNVRAVVPSFVELSDFELINALASQAGTDLGYRDIKDLTNAMPKQSLLDLSRVKFEPVKSENLLRHHKYTNTNALYNSLMKFSRNKL